jgi:hypothetical protein
MIKAKLIMLLSFFFAASMNSFKTEHKIVLLIPIDKDPKNLLVEGNVNFSKNVIEYLKDNYKKIYKEYNFEKAYKNGLLKIIENDIHKTKKEKLLFDSKKHKYANRNISIFYPKGCVRNMLDIVIECFCKKQLSSYYKIENLKNI